MAQKRAAAASTAPGKGTHTRFFSHNLIQATRHWLNFEGEDHVDALVRELVAVLLDVRVRVLLAVLLIVEVGVGVEVPVVALGDIDRVGETDRDAV
jgi:hypothetical protein